MKFQFLLASTSMLLFLTTTCIPETTQSADRSSVKFEVISVGKAIDLEPHRVAGAVTVFDFYADWCSPCKKLDRSLKDMKKMYGDKLVVLKLDLVEWDSELGKQFGIQELPYLIIYDEQGQQMGQGPANRLMPSLIAHLNKS